jgi:cell fate regulator YaaT (PSP1 superfamily)
MTQEQLVEEDKLPPANEIASDGETSEHDDDEESSLDRDDQEDNRFKDGQILRFVRVRFPGNSRSFPFLVGRRRIEYGQKVVAMSDRGMAVGYINSFPYEVAFNKSMLPIRSISKVASQEDITKDKEAYQQQKDAENICNDLIEQFQLDMHLTHVEFTSFGKKAVFYFIAPSRVDFRDLVKDLVGKLKTRIELRQISVRDRSAAIGGLGPCGRELCCSSFLTKYGNVGIKMAKNQDLTLNFSKLNGVCGQLKCCLQYEDEVYREKRSRLPKEGDYISTHTGEIGRVDRLHLLSEQFVMMTNQGVRKRYVVDLYKETLNKETVNFPKEFDSISDETHKIIGMDESKEKKVKAFELEVKTYKEKSKNFADGIFTSLFGEKSLNYSLPESKELESSAPTIKIPDEEEEIFYTPMDDDILPEDEDLMEQSSARPRMNSHQSASQDQRPQHRNDHRQQNAQRPDNRNQNPGQNRGRKDEGRQRPPNRPQGGGQGQNQGRNRPPR